MIFRLFIIFFTTVSLVSAEPLRLSSSYFSSEDFKKSFAGSYGFLAPVEPKVSRSESELLVKVRELFAQGQFSRAESELNRFIQANDTVAGVDGQKAAISPALVYVLGTLYFQAGRIDDARRAYLEAIRRYPSFRRAHTNLGFLYAKENQLEKALPHLQQAIELGENSDRVYGVIGFAYLSDDQAVAAETAYRQAIMLRAENGEWKKGLAQSLIVQEKFEEAASLLGTLIKKTPNDRNLYLQQANAFMQMEKKKEAAGILEIMRLRGLADESNLNLLGNIYIEEKEPQLALFAYLAAIEAQTQFNPDTALKSAGILNDYGYPDRAGALIEKIRRSGSGKLSQEQTIQLLLVDLKIAKAKENVSEVGELLNELLALDSTSGDILLEKGKYHESLADLAETDEEVNRQLAEARTNFQLASRLPGTEYAGLTALGQNYVVRERNYVKALEFLKKAAALEENANLKEYLKTVERAAARQKQKEEREAQRRAARKEGAAK